MEEGDEAPFPLEWPHKVSEIKKVLKIEKFPDQKIYLERQKGRERIDCVRTKESVGLCQTNGICLLHYDDGDDDGDDEEGHWTAGMPKNGPFRMIGKINEGCLLGFDAVRFDFRSGGAASD